MSQLTFWLGEFGDDQLGRNFAHEKRDRMADGDVTLLKGMAMEIVVGPVVTRKGGYAFDCWTPEEGFSRGYAYCRIEDAYYAQNVEIRSCNNGYSDRMIACNTVDEFVQLTI